MAVKFFLALMLIVSVAAAQDGHFSNLVVYNGAYAYHVDVKDEVRADKLTATRQILSQFSVTAPKIYATQEMLAPEFSNNGGQMNFRAGNGMFSVANGYVEFFVGTGIQQGTTWEPSVKFVTGRGVQIAGELALINNTGRGPGPIDICTGLGTGVGVGCDISEFASDFDGQIWLTAGVGAQAAGEIGVYFSKPMASNSNCHLEAVDLDAPWADGVTFKQIGSSPSYLHVRWSNNGQPLASGGAGPGQAIGYLCIAQPGQHQ